MSNEILVRKVNELMADVTRLRQELQELRPSMRSGVEGLAARQERLAGMLFLFGASWATTILKEEDVADLLAKMHAAWKGGQAAPAEKKG